eukprot:scaffold721_cov334-Pavlova_lutheri.AAC.2
MLRTYEKTEVASRRGLGCVEAVGAHQEYPLALQPSGWERWLRAFHAPPTTGRHAVGPAHGSNVLIRQLYEPVRLSRQSRWSLLETSPRGGRCGEDLMSKVPDSQSGGPGYSTPPHPPWRCFSVVCSWGGRFSRTCGHANGS